MMRFFIAPIIEGKAEIEAVPKLLHRLFRENNPGASLIVNPPLRVKSGSFLKDSHYFGRYLDFAARKAKANFRGSVLVLLDCEDDCPGILGPLLLEKARAVRPDVDTTVVLAHREFETWFLAAAKSLRGVAGFPLDAEPPASSETIRGAKEWIAKKMPNGYSEVNHQPLFAEHFSFEEAKVVPSFARFRRKMSSRFSTAKQ